MSRELHDFSVQIDEVFDLQDVESTDFWLFIVSIFA